MNKLANIRFVPLGNSIYIKPFKMLYEQNGVEKSWDMMEIHDSVAIVVYNITRDVMIFVKQFRPGVYYSHIKQEDRDKPISTTKYPAELGVTLELCAGIKDKEKPLIHIAKEEVLEETGYDVPLENIEKIHAWNSSVGISGNVVTLFYCYVTDDMKVNSGGGVGDELIDVVEMTIPQVREYMTQDIMPSPGSLITGLYCSTVGISGSVLTLFYCWVKDDMKVHSGGGVETELIELQEMTIPQVLEYMAQDVMYSPSSFVTGMYWFFANKLKN